MPCIGTHPGHLLRRTALPAAQAMWAYFMTKHLSSVNRHVADVRISTLRVAVTLVGGTGKTYRRQTKNDIKQVLARYAETRTRPETARSMYSVRNPADLCVLLSRNCLSSRYSSMLFFCAAASSDNSFISRPLKVARAAQARLIRAAGFACKREAQSWTAGIASPRRQLVTPSPAILSLGTINRTTGELFTYSACYTGIQQQCSNPGKEMTDYRRRAVGGLLCFGG